MAGILISRISLGLNSRRNNTAPFNGPLNAFEEQLYAVFGPNRALSSYFGPCWRVRRSTDNAEQDIGFSINGWVDQGALVSFAAGASLFIVRDYDKTGNGHDGVPAAATNQPRCVLNGVVDAGPNGNPAPVYDGTNDFMDIQTSTAFSRNQANLTYAAIARNGGTSGQIMYNVAPTTSLRAAFGYSSATVAFLQTRALDTGAAFTASGAVSSGAWSRVIGRGRYTSGAIDIAVNGTVVTNSTMTPLQNTPNSDSPTNVRIGASTANLAYLTGGISTAVLAQAALDMTALDAAFAQMMP